MKRKLKQGSSLYSFLAEQGVLETGDMAEIEAWKKRYWAEYRRLWKVNKRQRHKSYTILLDKHENRVVSTMAKSRHTSPTNYIKQSALATKGVADKKVVGEMRQLFIIHFGTVKSLIDKQLLSHEEGSKLLAQIVKIENVFFENYS